MIRGRSLGDVSFVAWLIIFILLFSSGVWLLGAGFDGLALKPSEISSGSQIWTLAAYLFVHFNFFHLILNLILLFSFGILTERIIGRNKFIIFFLISGIASGGIAVLADYFSGGQGVWHAEIIMGASGAIFALAGLFAVLLPTLRFSILFIPTLSLPSYFLIPSALAIFWAVSGAIGIPIGSVVQASGLIIGAGYGYYLKKKYQSKVQLLHGAFKEMEKDDIARFPSEDPSPILRISRDGTIIYSNSSGDSLLKKWGSSMGGLVPLDTRTIVSEVLKSNTVKVIELENQGKFFLLTFVPIIVSDYVNLYGRDITTLKEVQAKLRERNVELASLASHDMRTPLTSIISLTPMILQGKMGKITPKQKEILEIIYYDATRLDTIIRNMVDASRIDEGIAVYQFKKFNLKEMINGSVKTMYVMAKEKNVEIKSELDKELEIVADKDRVEQVISNLITNALKYGYQGGHIWVSAKKEKDSILISVKDNGNGIPKENLEDIFAKDFKVQKSAKRAIGGLGYGLYISKKIIEAHNGKIWAENDGSKGAVFYLRIPLNLEEASIAEAVDKTGKKES